MTPETVTVLGYRVRGDDPMWLGLDLARAEVREVSTAMLAMVGPDKAPPDHHLRVPWCHPLDRPHGWEDCAFYRVRPRRKGWRFRRAGDGWELHRP